MLVSNNETAKTLTIAYVNDNVTQSRTEFKNKNIEIINAEGEFTSTSPDCFRLHSPVYEINLPDSIAYIDNYLIKESYINSFPYCILTILRKLSEFIHQLRKFSCSSSCSN